MPTLGPGQIFGDYRLDALVSRGGMGEVWRAEKRGAGGWSKTVALKVVLPHLSGDERFAAMFLAEARIAAALDHVNVVPVFAFGRAGDHLYLEMEHVDGTDLARLLARRGRGLPVPLALLVAAEVLKGLAYAHERRFVHRDVKPHNVLISREGAVKIGDFGIAKANVEHPASKSEVKGTAGYIAPEILRGQPASARSDLFAVGLVLWECLTGARLFDGATEAERLTRTLECQVPPLDAVGVSAPPVLDEILARLIAREPEARYPDAGAALAAILAAPGGRAASSVELKALMATLPAAPTPPPGPTGTVAGEAQPQRTSLASRLDRSLGRRRTVVALGALALGALAAVWMVRPGRRRPAAAPVATPAPAPDATPPSPPPDAATPPADAAPVAAPAPDAGTRRAGGAKRPRADLDIDAGVKVTPSPPPKGTDDGEGTIVPE